jgi:ribonuclease HII
MPGHAVPGLARERAAWARGRLLFGIDEVGRGPLAGPVVAAVVAFPPASKRILGLRDSKVLTALQRDRLAVLIRNRAATIGIGAASCRVIDRVNIRVATAIAMRRALRRAAGECRAPMAVLIDGLPLPELRVEHDALVDGDAYCYSIAAAGVVAKVVRDRLMALLARRHPSYGWEHNMGYGTPEHLAALDLAGPTVHHRRSFMPVAQLKLSL